MKKIVFFFILLSSTLLVSCGGGCNYGEVRFTNTSSNPYNLFLDGTFESEIPGNTFIELNIFEGQHTAQVEQVSGFLLFPTIVTETLNVYGCEQGEWAFP